MSFSEEFRNQWDSLTNYLVSKMLTANDQGSPVAFSDLERILSNEKKKWAIPGQYNKIWFDNLTTTDSSVADAFNKELTAFTLKAVSTEGKSLSWLCTAGTAVGGAAIGFGITKLLAATPFLMTAATAGLGLFGVVVGSNISKNKKHDAADKICNEYKLQLQAEGEKLAEIVKLADK